MRLKDQTNFVVERDDYDRRMIEYYRDTLDASYSSSSQAYTGAQDRYPAGDLNWFPDLKTRWENGEVIVDEDVIVQLVPYNGTPETFVNAQIIADTVSAGGLSTNRIYELQRDQYYLHNAIFTVPVGKKLHLRAQAGEGKKPIIHLWETGTGGSPTRPPGNFVVLNGGDLEISDICIAGYYEYEPERLGGVQGGLINTTAIGSSIILDGVILSNIAGQHVRTGQNTIKVQITNSIFANMGALTTSNLGAGKGIDLREAACDSFIVVNNTFVNFQDRAIRHYNFSNPGAGTGLIQYGRIEHNTFVNGMGFHGLFSLGNVGPEIIITNNLFVDAFALGEDSTDATRAAEWANTGETYANGNNRITWIFTAPNDVTDWTVSNNYYAISDSGWAFLNDFDYGVASPLSYHINGRLGADSVDAFTMVEDFTLANTPDLMTNMMRWYEDTIAGGMRLKDQTNFVVERDDYDRRMIEYYRDTLNCGYPDNSPAAFGSTTGGPVGDLNWPLIETAIKTTKDPVANVFRLEQNYPNPFNPVTAIKFNIVTPDIVTLEVYNIAGQKIATLLKGVKMRAGEHSINWNGSSFASGVYFYKLTAGTLTETKKMVLLK
jgi:hypothetical protein